MAMHGHDPALAAAENYRAFAQEARHRSPVYEALASSVAADAAVLGFLDTLPPEKRQPNLLFAAARYLLGDPLSMSRLRTLISQDRGALEATMLTRRTQTNEPARCATLLPALAQLPSPLALIEVGASAGLTLLIDRYSYDYAGHLITGRDRLAPTLRCAPRGPVPLPARLPEITWRAGLDLNPLDVTADDDVRWLSCLVWPGEGDRAHRPACAGRPGSGRRDPGGVPLGGARLRHAAGPAAIRCRRPQPAGRLAVQRSARGPAGRARTRLSGLAVPARPGRPHAAGVRRRARNVAALAAGTRVAVTSCHRAPRRDVTARPSVRSAAPGLSSRRRQTSWTGRPWPARC
jgi:hypothetical protein